jgi:hypothetical protein
MSACDPDTESLLIMDDPEEELRQRVDDFFVSTATWTVAGFSRDFRWLVVCDPNDLRVFRAELATEGSLQMGCSGHRSS